MSPDPIRRLPRQVTESVRSTAQAADLSSAACELVLNSLQAGARSIRVTANTAAWALTVEDDGCGISAACLPLLGQRGCTSKQDMGCAGEALASLAQLSQQVTITTRAAGSFETHRKQLTGCADANSRLPAPTAPRPHVGPSTVASSTTSLCAIPRQRHGTTVSVVGFLHNQPVRRNRLMQQHAGTHASTAAGAGTLAASHGAAAAAAAAAARASSSSLQELRLALFVLMLPHTGVELLLQQAGGTAPTLHMPQDRPMQPWLDQLFQQQPLPPQHKSMQHPQHSPASLVQHISTQHTQGWQVNGCVMTAPAPALSTQQHQLLYVNSRPVTCPVLAQLLRDWFTRHVKASAAGGDTAAGSGGIAGQQPLGTSRSPKPGYVLLITCPEACCSTSSRAAGGLTLVADFSSSMGPLCEALQDALGPVWGSMPATWRKAAASSTRAGQQPRATTATAAAAGAGGGSGGCGPVAAAATRGQAAGCQGSGGPRGRVSWAAARAAAGSGGGARPQSWSQAPGATSHTAHGLHMASHTRSLAGLLASSQLHQQQGRQQDPQQEQQLHGRRHSKSSKHDAARMPSSQHEKQQQGHVAADMQCSPLLGEAWEELAALGVEEEACAADTRRVPPNNPAAWAALATAHRVSSGGGRSGGGSGRRRSSTCSAGSGGCRRRSSSSRAAADTTALFTGAGGALLGDLAWLDEGPNATEEQQQQPEGGYGQGDAVLRELLQEAGVQRCDMAADGGSGLGRKRRHSNSAAAAASRQQQQQQLDFEEQQELQAALDAADGSGGRSRRGPPRMQQFEEEVAAWGGDMTGAAPASVEAMSGHGMHSSAAAAAAAGEFDEAMRIAAQPTTDAAEGQLQEWLHSPGQQEQQEEELQQLLPPQPHSPMSPLSQWLSSEAGPLQMQQDVTPPVAEGLHTLPQWMQQEQRLLQRGQPQQFLYAHSFGAGGAAAWEGQQELLAVEGTSPFASVSAELQAACGSPTRMPGGAVSSAGPGSSPLRDAAGWRCFPCSPASDTPLGIFDTSPCGSTGEQQGELLQQHSMPFAGRGCADVPPGSPAAALPFCEPYHQQQQQWLEREWERERHQQHSPSLSELLQQDGPSTSAAHRMAAPAVDGFTQHFSTGLTSLLLPSTGAATEAGAEQASCASAAPTGAAAEANRVCTTPPGTRVRPHAANAAGRIGIVLCTSPADTACSQVTVQQHGLRKGDTVATKAPAAGAAAAAAPPSQQAPGSPHSFARPLPDTFLCPFSARLLMSAPPHAKTKACRARRAPSRPPAALPSALKAARHAADVREGAEEQAAAAAAAAKPGGVRSLQPAAEGAPAAAPALQHKRRHSTPAALQQQRKQPLQQGESVPTAHAEHANTTQQQQPDATTQQQQQQPASCIKQLVQTRLPFRTINGELPRVASKPPAAAPHTKGSNNSQRAAAATQQHPGGPLTPAWKQAGRENSTPTATAIAAAAAAAAAAAPEAAVAGGSQVSAQKAGEASAACRTDPGSPLASVPPTGVCEAGATPASALKSSLKRKQGGTSNSSTNITTDAFACVQQQVQQQQQQQGKEEVQNKPRKRVRFSGVGCSQEQQQQQVQQQQQQQEQQQVQQQQQWQQPQQAGHGSGSCSSSRFFGGCSSSSCRNDGSLAARLKRACSLGSSHTSSPLSSKHLTTHHVPAARRMSSAHTAHGSSLLSVLGSSSNGMLSSCGGSSSRSNRAMMGAPAGHAVLSLDELSKGAVGAGGLLVPAGVSRQQLQGGAVIAQVDSKLVLLRCGSALLALDQHAADERVQLEGLQQQLAGEMRLTPQQLPAAEAAAEAAGAAGPAVAAAAGAQDAGRPAGQQQQRQGMLLKRQVLQPPQQLTLTPPQVRALQQYQQQVEAWGWQVRLLPPPAQHIPGLSDDRASGGVAAGAAGAAAAPAPSLAAAASAGCVGRSAAPEGAVAESSATVSAASGCAAAGAGGVSLTAGLNQAVLLQQVPVLAGVALGAVDLQLYLHQLLDTAGSSSQPPPGVLRVLRSKACRGAVMFGTTLDRRQCRGLLQQLAATELCFMCAHGRPTTMPLLDLRCLERRLQQWRQRQLLGSAGCD